MRPERERERDPVGAVQTRREHRLREPLTPPAPVLSGLQHPEWVRGRAAGLKHLRVAIERVGEVGAERRVRLLVGDQVALGQRAQVGEAGLAVEVESRDPSPLERVAVGDQLEQLGEALIPVGRTRRDAGPGTIGSQCLLLIRAPRGCSTFVRLSDRLSISQSICQEPVMTTFITSPGFFIA